MSHNSSIAEVHRLISVHPFIVSGGTQPCACKGGLRSGWPATQRDGESSPNLTTGAGGGCTAGERGRSMGTENPPLPFSLSLSFYLSLSLTLSLSLSLSFFPSFALACPSPVAPLPCRRSVVETCKSRRRSLPDGRTDGRPEWRLEDADGSPKRKSPVSVAVFAAAASRTNANGD